MINCSLHPFTQSTRLHFSPLFSFLKCQCARHLLEIGNESDRVNPWGSLILAQYSCSSTRGLGRVLRRHAPLEIACTILYIFGFLYGGDSLKQNDGLIMFRKDLSNGKVRYIHRHNKMQNENILCGLLFLERNMNLNFLSWKEAELCLIFLASLSLEIFIFGNF